MQKQEIIKNAITWAQKKGFKAIKANHPEFEIPVQYTNPNEEETYTPDITGKKLGCKSYIEIAMKTDNVQRRVTKWKLLSKLSAIKGGKLFLLAPSGHKAFTERVLKQHNLMAQVISLPNL
ncbi:MAG: hypothetical protein Sapg2KO_44430 [Saprospiraceae bacterium]